MKSIRHDLIRSLRTTLVVLLLAVGVIAYWLAQRVLVSDFDAALRSRANVLASLVEFENGSIIFEFVPGARGNLANDAWATLLPEFEHEPDADYLEIWNSAGNLVVRSPSLAEHDLVRPGIDAPDRTFDVELPDGRPGRATTHSFIARVSENFDADADAAGAHSRRATLTLATSRAGLDRRLAWLIQGIAILEAGVLIAVLWIVRTRVRDAFAPLDRFSMEVARIDAESLDKRVSTGDQPVELVGVSERLNQLIERLQSAFQRERRFTSAAAHELRTPIAELRALAEVSSKWSEQCSAQDHMRAFGDVSDISQQMDRLVQSMLAIARGTEMKNGSPAERVDLSHAVRHIVAAFHDEASAKRIAFDVAVSDDACARTSRDAVLLILRNLVENAVEYSPAGSTVKIAATGDDGLVRLRVTNMNEALVAEDLPRLFEPFWRKSEARTSSGHSGLGLAVVDTVAKSIGASVVARLDTPRLFTVELTLRAHASEGVDPVRAS